ncbi:MAG: hypothetical protein U0P30_16345 [Vicinamibacterales bacterium]
MYDVGTPPDPGAHDKDTVRLTTVAGCITGGPGAAGPATVKLTVFVLPL